MAFENNMKDVRFYVGDEEYSQLPFIAVIPTRYKELFDGVRFKNRQHLAEAVLYAECAEAARTNGNHALLEKNESILMILLNKYEPSLDERLSDAAGRSTEVEKNEYLKTRDGWFEYYVNTKTGEKKMALDEGDVCVERRLDDFVRNKVKE